MICEDCGQLMDYRGDFAEYMCPNCSSTYSLMDVVDAEMWYPVFAQELYQTIDDCDVIERYQGIIQNSVSGGWIEIEDLQTAIEECKRLNDIIDGDE